MTRITQLDSNLLHRIFLRSPLTMYLNSGLRRIAVQSETLCLKDLSMRTLLSLQEYRNVKRLVCRWWYVGSEHVLPPSLTSLYVENAVFYQIKRAPGKVKLPILGLEHLVNLTIVNSESLELYYASLPKSLTRLYIGDNTFCPSIDRRNLPYLSDTNLICAEEDYDPVVNSPVSSVLDGKNPSITYAVVPAIHPPVVLVPTALTVYKNLTKLYNYATHPMDTEDIAILSSLTVLRSVILTGRWECLSVLTKLHTVIVNINASVCLNQSPPNLTHLDIRANSIAVDSTVGRIPPLLILHIRGGEFPTRLIEEDLPATLRVLTVEPLMSVIECFSAPLTTLTLRLQGAIRIRRLPATLTYLDLAGSDMPSDIPLLPSLRTISARSITGTFYLPNFREAYCAIRPIITRHKNGMVIFSKYVLPPSERALFIRFLCSVGLLILACVWIGYRILRD